MLHESVVLTCVAPVLYEEKNVLKMALLAWNPGHMWVGSATVSDRFGFAGCESKIHDHPLGCWEAHLHGPPLQEVTGRQRETNAHGWM